MSYKGIKGSWYKTARDIKYENQVLECKLLNIKGKLLQNKIKINPVKTYTNIDGVLRCEEDNVKVAILLTTCFRNNKNSKDIYKREYYKKSIKLWQKSNLPIFIVESSNYSLKKYENQNIKTCTFDLPEGSMSSSTQYEAKSILHALEVFKEDLKNYSHVIKITGRYFIKIKKILDNLTNVDLFLQYTKSHKWNNSEIFGFRLGIEDIIFKRMLINGTLMEEILYDLSKEGYTYIRLPPINNFLNVKRSDSLIIQPL